MLETVTAALDELLDLDPAHIDDDNLTAAVTAVVGSAAAKLDAVAARLVAEWDRRKLWKPSGSLTGAAWLEHTCQIPSAAAKRVVRRARLADDFLPLFLSLAAGDITAHHVDRLARARNRRTHDAMVESISELLETAKRESWRTFDRTVECWTHHHDADGPEPRHERRAVSLSQSLGGEWALNGWLDPISGQIIDTELRRLEQVLFQHDWDAAKLEQGRDPFSHELARTAQQRRADALVDMAQRSAEAPGGVSLRRPLFTVAVGADILPRLCELVGGTIVHPDELARWLPAANLDRILFHDDGRTITHHQRRLFPEILARAIRIKHRECFHPFCHVPSHLCEIDHALAFSKGGLTSFDNGRPACGRHNRARNTEHDLPPAETGSPPAGWGQRQPSTDAARDDHPYRGPPTGN